MLRKKLETGPLHASTRWLFSLGMAAFAITMFTLVPGCPSAGGGGGGGGDGDECTTDADCMEGEVCTDGMCEAGPMDECETDADCMEGEVCTDGMCVDAGGPACETDADCMEGEVCTDGECVDAGGPACETDADCMEGEVCTDGECVDDMGPACETDADCEEGQTCTDGECVDVPDEDNDLADLPPTDPDTGAALDFGDLTEGQGVNLQAPRPVVENQASDDDCECTWSTNGAGTFSPNPGCATVYTPGAGDTGVSVTVTCDDGAMGTFNQSVGVTPGSSDDCTTDDDCPDGQVCEDGTCVDDVECVTDDDCAEGEVCDNGVCVESGPCDDDADCDDGLFCNGIETCDAENENADANGCVAGDDPCADLDCGDDTPTCSEGDDAAECECPPVEGINLSLGQDSLTGTTGNDTFSAPLEFNAPGGAQVETFQTGDSLNGLAGNDILNASFITNNANVVPALVSGVETVNATVFSGGAGATINATNITGTTVYNSVGSTADLFITGVQQDVDMGFVGVENAAVDLQVTLAQAAITSGTMDSFNVSIGSTAGDATVVLPAAAGNNGYESATVISTGGTTNTLTRLRHLQSDAATNASSITSVNFMGEQALTVNTLPGTITTIDGTMMTGGLTLGAGTETASYAEFNNPASNWVNILGGSGDDVIIFEDTLASTDFTAGLLDLGDGNDVVQNSFAASFVGVSKLRNVEEVRYDATNNGVSVNFSGHTGLSMITIEEDNAAANTFTLSNIAANAGVFPTLNYRGDNVQGAQTFDTVTYTATGATGTTDVFNCTVGNRGTALNATGTTNVFTIGGAALSADNFETANITVSDGPATFSGFNSSTLINLDVNGSSNVTMGTVNTDGNVTIQNVDATGVMGVFNATIDHCATGVTISSGDGNDIVTIGNNSTATSSNVNLGNGNNTFTADGNTSSNDTITTGTGNDTVTPGAGADTVFTGTGTDRIIRDFFDIDERMITTVQDFDVNNDSVVFDVSSIAGVTGVTQPDNFDGVAITAGEAFTFARQTADAFDPGAVDLVLLDVDFQTYADAAAALADRANWTIVIDTDTYDDNDALLVGYGDGSGNTRFGVFLSSAADEDNTDNMDDAFDILILVGINPDNLVANNFGNWQ